MKKIVSLALVLVLALCLCSAVSAYTGKVCPVCTGTAVTFEFGKYHCTTCLHTWDEVGMTGEEPDPAIIAAAAAPAAKSAPVAPLAWANGKVCPVCTSRAVSIQDGMFHCTVCQHHWAEVA